ncbi:hypothetical protein QN277_019619 [Acacia crassicarpa]|uniref:Bifunctional inhibitor/plant lipid transfer protein/seed storage helical domain-containing protein n=1 Tax=Acacia crassicarpa TaxID=499986 RepID=A0AAE1MNH8_9FABA|nr:hypothetical protein QN277_019616 [Acacia crassicarpa]KAK4270850.1 hypothetical protein QN277_019619 [Acacia crassicarpa]
MALKSLAFLLSLNLLFFTMVSSTYDVPSTGADCPIGTLQLGLCANALNLVNLVVGSPPTVPCCSLIQGLADLQAAACLCTIIKGNVLGISLNVPVDLSLILNNCGRTNNGYQCA